MKDRIFVIVPTYNEAENIQQLVGQILDLPQQVGVIVVDDNSPDGTASLVEEIQQAEGDRVHLICRPGKLGLGTAYVAGFELALEHLKADQVLTMDADFSHLPRYIPDLIRMGESCHVVIGSRYVPGGGTEHWPWTRKLLSWGANSVARLVLGLQAHDTTAGFRLYRREVLEAIRPEGIQSAGYSYLIEILFRCEREGFLVGEVPIIFVDRQQGTSKISRSEITRALWTVIQLFPKRIGQKSRAVRPMDD